VGAPFLTIWLSERSRREGNHSTGAYDGDGKPDDAVKWLATDLREVKFQSDFFSSFAISKSILLIRIPKA
jgi:hypothetical protein